MSLTYSRKRVQYRAGMYMFKVPPVCHANWDEHAWINWIDNNGVWL